MNQKNKKLTDKDKSTLSNHSNICTDSHGKNCNVNTKNEKNSKLN